MNKHPYILGTGDQELDRLADQHAVWRSATQNLWERAEFRAGQHIVDLGCGPGFTSFELAERVGPGGKVSALDNSRRFIELLSRWRDERGIEQLWPMLADAYAPGLRAGCANGVFIRWLLCFLPDTQQVVNGVAQALAPGGRLVVMDYFNYLSIRSFPASGIFKHVFEQIYRSFADSGGDLDVGGALPQLMSRAGLEIEHIEPVIHAVRPGDEIWNWVRDFQKSYLPKLVDKGYLSTGDIEANDQDWRDRECSPDSFFLSPPMLGVIARKPD